MVFKKILFVGLGGAGQRHMRIFRELLPFDTEFTAYRTKNTTPLLNADFSINKNHSVEEKYRVQLFDSFAQALENQPDLIVISNPTSLHYETAMQASMSGIHIFVEKPFSHNLNGFEEFRNNILSKNLLFFVSFQRRHHKLIVKTKEIVDSGQLGKIMSVKIDVASYVPNWHPYEDFRDLYACRRELGGGVLLTEIHEIDLCYQFFGMPSSIFCRGGNYSDFQLDVEDTVDIILAYSDFNINLSLSFMQPHIRRNIYIAGTKGFVECNMELCFLDVKYHHKKGENISIVDSQYSMDKVFYEQANFFFNKFQLSHVASELDAAYATLAIVEACKQSILKSQEIKL